MRFTEYISRPGDRWDLIAYKAYGTVDMILLEDGSQVNAMSYLIQNNPDIPKIDILVPGLLIQVPIIPVSVLPVSADSLPPWKK